MNTANRDLARAARATAATATRVRKARHTSRLACGHWVQVGQLIARRGGRWVCLECALAATGATTSQGQEGGR